GIELSRTIRNQIWQCRHPLLNRFWRRVRIYYDIEHIARSIARHTLPSPIRTWIRARFASTEYVPPVGWVRFGSFRRTAPFSRAWGTDRGLPIDRYYIEKFLAEHSSDIYGHVLEIGDNRYTSKFGSDKVVQSDVLHVVHGNRKANLVADLTCADGIPAE